jgi:hypothetical protein
MPRSWRGCALCLSVTVHFGEATGFNHKTRLHATLSAGAYHTIPETFEGTAIAWDDECGAGCNRVLKVCPVGIELTPNARLVGREVFTKHLRRVISGTKDAIAD